MHRLLAAGLDSLGKQSQGRPRSHGNHPERFRVRSTWSHPDAHRKSIILRHVAAASGPSRTIVRYRISPRPCVSRSTAGGGVCRGFCSTPVLCANSSYSPTCSASRSTARPASKSSPADKIRTACYRLRKCPVVVRPTGRRWSCRRCQLPGARQKVSARCHSSAAACSSYSLGRLGSVNK